MSGNLPQTVQNRTTTEVLKKTGKYTDAQISQMIKPPKTEGKGKGPYRGPRCNKWGYLDYARALRQRLTSRKAYQDARKKLNLPLPGISTLNKIFRDLAFKVLLWQFLKVIADLKKVTLGFFIFS